MMVRTQIQLSESQMAFVKAVAQEENISMEEVIRSAIELLRQSREKPTQRELMVRSLAAIGSANVGPEDVSARHDDYLDEAFGPW